jgi:hypothetical protein
MFDKICLIYEGHMIYFGPADQALGYFVDMGFQPKPRQTVADFLVSVTNPSVFSIGSSILTFLIVPSLPRIVEPHVPPGLD